MTKEIVYWTMADDSKIDIDKMNMYHLRNALKFVVGKTENKQNKVVNNKSSIVPFTNKEINSLINKSQYQFENEENIWK